MADTGALSNFLFQGQPSPVQPTGSDTSSSFPLWMQQYVYNLSNSASNLAATPYTPFPGQQVADPSQETKGAWDLAGKNVGNWGGALQSAYGLTGAAGTPITNNVTDYYAGNYAPTVSGMGSQLTGALNQNIQGNTAGYQKSFNQGVGSAGSGFTDLYNNKVTGAIPSYLSPYTKQVIGGIENSMNTNLMENVLPGVSSSFVSAGQSRSPQEMEMTNQALYRNQQAIGQAVAPALEQGYNTSLGAAQKGADTGFGLGTQGYGSALGSATGAANTGFNMAGQGYQGALNTGLSEQQMQQQAGAQMGNLGALTQQLGSGDIAQLSAAGQEKNQFQQNNINAALQNFYAQQQWPYQNLAFESNIIRGLPVNSSSQTVGTTYLPPSYYGASPLASFAQGAGQSSATGLKKGGRVKKPTNDNRRGALSERFAA